MSVWFEWILKIKILKFKNMPIPSNLHYHQGIIVAELGLTLLFFVIFQITYYAWWGYDEDEAKPTDKKKEGDSQEEQPKIGKWDQNTWNVYFPMIFANHIIALTMPMIYSPNVFTIVIAYLHFALFLVLCLVNIFIMEEEPGKGNRTMASMIIWTGMCMLNIILIVTGLVGTSFVLTAVG